MTTDPILERVLAGARLLDSSVRGWRRKIRRRDLDLEAGYYAGPGRCGCVLAQLAGDRSYEGGLDELGIDEHEAIDLGFDAANSEYDELTNTWRRVLRENLR